MSDASTAATIGDAFDDYAESHDDPRFTDWLRERSEPAWSNAVDHRFTQELGAGTLDEAVMLTISDRITPSSTRWLAFSATLSGRPRRWPRNAALSSSST